VFRKVHQVVEVREHTDYREFTDKIVVPEGQHILIMPGETVLGITRERLRLGPCLCGWLEGRSRFARLGLMGAHQRPVHGAGYQQPAGAGDEQLRPRPACRGARHRHLPVCVPTAPSATPVCSPGKRRSRSRGQPKVPPFQPQRRPGTSSKPM
jgi:hypothetical protein